MNEISLKGIVAGGIVHYLLSRLLTALPIIYALLPLLTEKEIGFERLGALFLNAIEGSARLPYLYVLAELASALIAGYAAARIAGKNELLNGCLGALPCSALAAFQLTAKPAELVSVIDVALIAAAFAFALVGGFLASLRVRSVPNPQPR